MKTFQEIGKGILGKQKDEMKRKILRQAEERKQGVVV